jgi:hypothetical protein
VETDIRPFHDVLLLFISIGMMLDWRIVLSVGRRVHCWPAAGAVRCVGHRAG